MEVIERSEGCTIIRQNLPSEPKIYKWLRILGYIYFFPSVIVVICGIIPLPVFILLIAFKIISLNALYVGMLVWISALIVFALAIALINLELIFDLL